MYNLERLLNDDLFLSKLVTVNSPDELQSLFGEFSIELEEGVTVERAFDVVKQQENGELFEGALDEVNGGFGVLATFTVSVAVLHFIAGYGYEKYGKKK